MKLDDKKESKYDTYSTYYTQSEIMMQQFK